jgi:hypothetical protein
MGYIAPITNYQYAQYAERVIEKGYDPYRFVAITKIKPLNNQQENNYPNLQEHSLYVLKVNKSHKMSQQEWADKQYSQITGIGQNFNKYA